MKLKYFKRSAEKKSESNRVRLEGNIPAVIYVQGQESDPIAISNAEFSALLRQVQQGRLSTTIFTLVDENGVERKVLIKDLQYGIPNYEIIHLDFEELHEDRKVNVKVPIECVGQADCVGVKLGGVLRQVIRHLLVNCLPKDIPVAFELDVRSMGIRDSRRLSALSIPEGVRPVADLKEVAAVIVKR